MKRKRFLVHGTWSTKPRVTLDCTTYVTTLISLPKLLAKTSITLIIRIISRWFISGRRLVATKKQRREWNTTRQSSPWSLGKGHRFKQMTRYGTSQYINSFNVIFSWIMNFWPVILVDYCSVDAGWVDVLLIYLFLFVMFQIFGDPPKLAGMMMLGDWQSKPGACTDERNVDNSRNLIA